MADDRPLLRLAHSPDPDDAFMWWAVTPDRSGTAPLDTGRFRFEPLLSDIESLNRRSGDATYEVTAISCAQYPYVADRYAITSCGASMGQNYGPKLVTRGPGSIDEIKASDSLIAVPGLRTTAALLAAMVLDVRPERFQAVPFDEIISRMEAGEFDAGVVIHEGQLTFEDAGLHLVRDVGEWWFERKGLPLPLGLNVIRRDLDEQFGPGTVQEITDLLYASIHHAHTHRDEAVGHALQYARGVSNTVADRFVELYVNDLTTDSGDQGRTAIETLLAEGHRLGHLPAIDHVDIITARPAIPTPLSDRCETG